MKKRTRETSLPDITPLIDVVFLLLIFFMVSTVFKKDELALLLSLPKTSKGDATATADKNIVIELTTSQLAYNGQKTTLEEIDGMLSQITKKDISVELRIDKEVIYNRVVELLDKLKKYDLSNLSLITEK